MERRAGSSSRHRPQGVRSQGEPGQGRTRGRSRCRAKGDSGLSGGSGQSGGPRGASARRRGFSLRNSISTISTLRAQTSKRVLWVTLIAVLAFGLAIAPRRAIAQQAAPAAFTPQSSADAAKPHESATKEADEEANNTFRHNALVKSAARLVYPE